MFFDEVPPNTSVYMIAGYVIFFVVTAIYVASLFIRTRNLDKDLEALKGLQEQEQAPVPGPVAAAPRNRTAKPKSSGKSKQARKKAPKRR